MTPTAQPSAEVLAHRIGNLERSDERRSAEHSELREMLSGLRTDLAVHGERLKTVADDVKQVSEGIEEVKQSAQAASPTSGAAAGGIAGGAVSAVAVFFGDLLRRAFGG